MNEKMIQESLNDNVYSVPDDISAAEEVAQRRNEGRRLAIIRLSEYSGGRPTTLLSGDQISLICEAAAYSAGTERILELERETEELKGQNRGLRYQLDNASMQDQESVSELRDDLTAALRVIEILGRGE